MGSTHSPCLDPHTYVYKKLSQDTIIATHFCVFTAIAMSQWQVGSLALSPTGPTSLKGLLPL